MFSITRIEKMDDPHYQTVDRLYETAFPYHEKRDERAKQTALDNESYHLNAWYFNDVFVGFIGCWQFKDYAYIEHLAIDPSLRSQGFGKKVLERFMAQHPLTILEIDPLTTEIANRRLRFYQGLGFVENSYSHTHPSYHSEINDHELVVLSSKKVISNDQYVTFLNDLQNVVMLLK
ncbi:MAG: GNAT family N-acetyltransferase [Hafnia sp.]